MEEKKKVVYLCSARIKIDHLDDIDAAEGMLTDLGYNVISPSLLPGGLTNGQYNLIAGAMLNAADAVVVLPNWRESQVSVGERHLAGCFDKPIVEVKVHNIDLDGTGVNPPCIVQAWLKHDLEKALGEALGEVSA